MDLSKLPLELTLQILSHIDTVSIQSCLEAFPFLKKFAVIILLQDHGKSFGISTYLPHPRFYRLAGVARRAVFTGRETQKEIEQLYYSGGPKDEPQQQYNPEVDTFPIKLVECCAQRIHVQPGDLFAPVDVLFLPPHEVAPDFYWRSSFADPPLVRFDATTYLSLYWCDNLPAADFVEACDFLEQYTRAKISMWRLERTLSHPSSTKLSLRSVDVSTRLDTASLAWLHLEGLHSYSLQSIDLPQLEKLSVSFPKIRSTDERPSLSNITLPYRCHLEVNYHHRIPSFDNVTTRRLTLRDLATAPDLGLSPQTVIQDTEAEAASDALVKLPSEAVYLYLHGVTTSVLQGQSFPKLYLLVWTLTKSEHLLSDSIEPVSTPRICYLTIRVMAAGVRIPAFIHSGPRQPPSQSMQSLMIAVLADDVDLDTFTGQSELIMPSSLYFFRAPALSVSRRSEFSFKCKDHWSRFLPPVEKLTLIGFEMPFLAGGEDTLNITRVLRFHCRPFIPAKDCDGELDIYLPGCHSWSFGVPVTYKIFPILEKPRPSTRPAGRLNIHIADNSRDYVCHLGPEFESYTLNGCAAAIQPFGKSEYYDHMPSTSEVEADIPFDPSTPRRCSGAILTWPREPDAQPVVHLSLIPDVGKITRASLGSKWDHTVLRYPHKTETCGILCEEDTSIPNAVVKPDGSAYPYDVIFRGTRYLDYR